MTTPPLIDCRDISVRTGRHLLLDNLTFRVAPGERVVLTGPSGAGKSTLLRTIAGLEALSGGEIRLNGQPASIAGNIVLPPHQRGISMVLQDLGLWPTLSVLQHLLLASRPSGRNRAEQLAAARALLDQMGLTLHARRRPGNLSGGEQQRVALGTALMGNPRALLLDEPFQALDLVLKDQLLGIVDTWASAHGCAVICVTHDVSEARQLSAQRLVIMESGRIAADISWDAVMNNPASHESPTLAAWRQRLRSTAAGQT